MMVLIAVAGAFLVCFGSMFGILAPGDGQTGMLLFPLWGAGGVLGVISIVLSWQRRAPIWQRGVIVILALGALVSVVWSFVAAQSYSAELSQRGGKPASPQGKE